MKEIQIEQGGQNLPTPVEKPSFIGIRQVCEITGFSKSTILRRVADGEFPREVINEGIVKRWDYAEVMRWRAAQFLKRDARVSAAQLSGATA